MSVEVYRDAERYITITGDQIGEAQELTDIDAQAEAVVAELKARAALNRLHYQRTSRIGLPCCNVGPALGPCASILAWTVSKLLI
jgi:hypothetical protein